MSIVYIGNAVGDEHGRASGGEPGDQTGKELKIQPWYKNKKGWRVFRAKSADVRTALAADMRAACDNAFIGYDQKQRNTLYAVAALDGFDCAKVTTSCECDCSSLVRVCLAYAGIIVKDFNTASEPARLLATGDFEELTDQKYTDGSAYLMKGDLLCTKVKGHTAIVLNDGDKAHEPEPVPTAQYVEVVGKSVRVRATDSVTGKTVEIVHKGDLLPFLGVAPSGWYCVDIGPQMAYITNKPKYTRLV